jgi:primase-polymerase (primpol)-like protein
MRRTHRWVNHDEAKRPISPTNGRWASTTNPRTWSTLARARERSPRVGYVLGAGIGCIDLDHAIRDDGTLTEGARALVDAYPGNWIEVSPSGRGLHIWGRAEERTGFRKAWRGQAVEFYSQGRFITVTGRTFQRGQLEPL